MWEKLRTKSRAPSVNPYMRMIDPDLGMPDIFYMMDEIGRTQILRKYTVGDDQKVLPCYCGTYEILYKTERAGRFCLIMHRCPDEWQVSEHHRMEGEEEMRSLIVAEYYPGVLCRIYLKGLSRETVESITEEFVHRVLRKKKRKKLKTE